MSARSQLESRPAKASPKRAPADIGAGEPTALRRVLVLGVLIVGLSGCLSPAASLMLSLLPEGTFTTLLRNMQGVETSNRTRVAELAAQGDWAAVADYAEQQLELDSTNADWWTVAGYAYTELQDYSRAERAFAEAVRLSPDDLTYWNLLAQSQRALGKPDQAIRTLQNALHVSRESPMIHFLLGESHADLQRPAPAVRHYEEAVRRNPEFVEAWYGLGRAYWALGRQNDYRRTIDILGELSAPAARQLTLLSAEAP